MFSEAEMKEYFQRIIDQVSTLSTQAARVEGLEARINELAEKVRAVSEENANLLNRLQTAEAKSYDVQQSLDTVQHQLDIERGVSQSLRDTIVGRDTKVAEVETNLGQERDAHRVTLSERDDARRHVTELEGHVNSFRDQLGTTRQERDQWQAKAEDLERQVTDLNRTVERIKAVFNPGVALHAVG